MYCTVYCVAKIKNFDVFNCIISVDLPNLVRLSPQLCGWKFSVSPLLQEYIGKTWGILLGEILLTKSL